MRRINAARCSKNVKIVLKILSNNWSFSEIFMAVLDPKGAHRQFTKKNPVKLHFITILFWIMHPTTKLGALSKRDGRALYIL